MTPPEPAPDLDRIVAVFEQIPHCAALGIRVIELRPGVGFMGLDWDERLIGNPTTGHVHGGVITTLLDTLGGLVVMSVVPPGTGVATLDLRIDYLRPGTPGAAIRARAECYRLTDNVAFVRGLAYHDTVGAPIANCTATFMVWPGGFSADGAEGAGSGGTS